jgi:hypothetical protein
MLTTIEEFDSLQLRQARNFPLVRRSTLFSPLPLHA